MKIPVEIQKVKDPDGVERFRLTMSLHDALMNTSLNKQIIYTQEKYKKSVNICKDIIDNIRKSRRNAGDSVLKWYLSDVIYSFLKGMEEDGLVLVNFAKSFSRDLGVSVSQINYMIEFRTTYPEIEMINNKISWDKYKEILDVSDRSVRKMITEKLISRELKTREDIRKLKKEIKFRSRLPY
jgi:hypothetical protein